VIPVMLSRWPDCFVNDDLKTNDIMTCTCSQSLPRSACQVGKNGSDRNNYNEDDGDDGIIMTGTFSSAVPPILCAIMGPV